MSTKAFHDALEALFENDATFRQAIADVVGSEPTVLHGTRSLEDLPQHQLPALVMEIGEGEEAALTEGGDEEMTIGHTRHGWRSTAPVALVWHEADREAAYNQRVQLPDIFVQLMLRNPAPGDVNNARMTGYNSDRGGNHPTQVMSFELYGEYEIERN